MPGQFFSFVNVLEIHLFFFRQRYLGPVPHDTSYYAKCMLGGILACGITHAGITPLDVAKCNMQVDDFRAILFAELMHFYRLALKSTLALAPLFVFSSKRKVPPVSGRVSVLPLSATLYRECSNMVYTKFSRIST